MLYAIELTPDDNDTFLVTCPALPEVTTFAESEDQAMEHARAAIEEAIAARINNGSDVPLSARHVAGPTARLSALASLKITLYQMVRLEGITRAELARRLGWNRESVDRLFRLDHGSRLDQIEAAFRALGLELDLVVQPRAA